MASWSSNPPPNPSHAGGDDPSLRDACEAGTLPPAASTDPRPEQADTSPTQHGEAASRPLPLEVERALRLIDELKALGIGRGSVTVSFHDLTRATFDAIASRNSEWFAGDETGREFWLKRIGLVTFFTYEPPVESEAA